LRESGWGRIGSLVGPLTAGVFVIVALVLRGTDGDSAALGRLVVVAGRVLVWLAGFPLGLAAASALRSRDRDDGIEALAAGRGLNAHALAAVRVIAAMAQATLSIGAPLMVIAITTVALAGTARGVAHGLVVVMGSVLFGAVAGVTLGGLGAACARFAGSRGARAFLALILVPLALADLAGRPALSVTGALDAALRFTIGATR
jgi:hypothetical protein